MSSLPPTLTGGPFLAVDTDVGPLWMLATDGVMRDYISHARTWEPEEGRLLARLARPGMRFLDVGGNVGYFSIFVHRRVPGSTIHVVEPNPVVLPLLRFNLWLNEVDATVWPLALGAQRGGVGLFSAPANLGDTRTTAVGAAETITTIVPMDRGDHLWPGETFDVVKLDVQGAELDAIRGMVGTLEANPDVVVVAEFWPTALRERGDDPVATLDAYRELGFHVAVQVADDLLERGADEIVEICDSGGQHGQVNLVLRWA